MDSIIFDLAKTSLREVNQHLHHDLLDNPTPIKIINSDGAHNIAIGLNAPVDIEIIGHTGYYAASMNKLANVTITGNAGTGVAENMMSGRVHVKGFASVSAGSSAHGGLLIIDGNAGLRCGISLKGGNIVVGGNVGSFSAFMAQAGRIVVCGDAGDALGDSLYEAIIYVRGNIKSLGADAQIEPMLEADYLTVGELLGKANLPHHPKEFKKVASAKQLYHWNADANQEY
ncbi:glutamate synthase [Synechocystis sp. PCC 7509]|uniref:GltB/FmdC/FwdC-like GXGXG domain-containing protein n=1 Tax=Synechocystis sp. PCC 7509 TaxID=927677 RepID=UPI0002AC6D7C|nr:glutamate synthase [Synechocystis sp. PCC 7509]